MARRLMTLFLLLALFFQAAAEAPGSILLYDRFSVSADSEIVDLGDMKIVNLDKLRAYLDQLPRLKTVRMPKTRLSAAQLDALTLEYPGVFFECSFGFVKGAVSTAQTAYSTLNTLRDKRYPETRFFPLRHCVNLRALDLGHNEIQDLSFLGAFPRLAVLILADNRVSDLGPLAELKELEYLELFMNNITDLGPLSGLTSLRDLNLTRNRVTDITPLLGLTRLERLWIPDNFLTREQKEQLEAALPNCKIVYEWSKSTGHGWRDHPRYDAIMRMFRSGNYEPFQP